MASSSNLPCSSDDVADWRCPDCSSSDATTVTYPPPSSHVVHPAGSNNLITAIREIEADPTLCAQEKAHRRQQLLLGRSGDAAVGSSVEDGKSNSPLFVLNKNISCSFCMLLPERPITDQIKPNRNYMQYVPI
uniref:Uncharacterized protein n=1 Tax=Oryza brachyantha TaxID=4533 RepID=J3LWI9_ORYBR